MHRTTISLSDDLAAIIKDEAVRRGTSVSEVVRTSIVQMLVPDERRALPFAELCDDREMTRGSELEEELERMWGCDLESDRR